MNDKKIEFNLIKKDECSIILKVSGKIDTLGSIEFETEVKNLISDLTKNFTTLKFDFCDLEYLCSSGLRVILWSKKQLQKLNENAVVVIKDPQPNVSEVLNITGFSEEVVEIENSKGEKNDIS